jgi:hypothetical protein
MKIIFGALVTNGAGSIGGQFVKRIKNGHSLNNKPQKASLQKLLQNTNVYKIGKVAQVWKTFDYSEKLAWSNASLLFPQTDKFGKTIILSGRMFFQKLLGKLSIVDAMYTDPSGISSDTFISGIDDFDVIVADSEFNFYQNALGVNGWNLIRVARTTENATLPTFLKTKVIFSSESFSATSGNIFTQVTAQLGTLQAGQYIIISTSHLNQYGFEGEQTVFKWLLY